MTINKINPGSVGVEEALEQAPEKEITRRVQESQTAYLQRTGDLVTRKMKKIKGILFNPARTTEDDLPENILQMIESIITEALTPQESAYDQLKNEKIIQSIGEVVGYHHHADVTDSVSFDTYQRNRAFFEVQPGEPTKHETYWNTLFFPYNTKATRAFAQKILDDKKIVLLGGGRSKLQKELHTNQITLREIVNVDPFVENVERGADPVISLSASDKQFIQKMRKQGIVNVDEIWAEYSVPAYLRDPQEIRQLIQNCHTLLATGGSARIWPIQVSGRGNNSDLLARKNALIESLQYIVATNKYEVVLYGAAGRHGLILHKLTS